MPDLLSILTRLGVDQYYNALIGEGFETWETVLDIQESDLDALKFKRGHRRKLQREIANYRGVPYDRSIGSQAADVAGEAGRGAESSPTSADIGDRGFNEAKRKYIRHPKPDENSPLKPPSAYVIFSNKIRDDIRSQNLSFTEIAKLVGDKWQKLTPADKEPYETQANTAKEKYNAELAKYKHTDEFKEYSTYLADFKSKHGGSAGEGKRPKLENNSSSGASTSTRSTDAAESTIIAPNHIIVSPVMGMGSPASLGSAVSPSLITATKPSASSGQGFVSLPARLPPISPTTDTSPTSIPRDSRSYSTFSRPSSMSAGDEAALFRDQSDPLQRTAQLSILSSPSRIGEPFSPGPGPGPTSFISMPGASTNSTLAYTQRSNSSSRSPTPMLSMASANGYIFPHPLGDDTRRTQLPKATQSSPPTYATTQYYGAPLAPLISPGRLPDTPQDQNQRILPLPLAPTSKNQPPGLRSVSGGSTGGLPPDPPPPNLPSLRLALSQEGHSHHDSSEADAADALADLAYGNRKSSTKGHN